MVKIKQIRKLSGNIFRIILFTTGMIFLLLIILAFTSLPFWSWYNLSTKYAGINRPPDFIVVLGGGGMPSESGLIRCWYAAKAANHFTKAKIIIALPGDTTTKKSSINSMKNELLIRGIAADRILLENTGTNTRAQALNIIQTISNIEQRMLNGDYIRNSKFVDRYSKFKSLLIVTSPEHLTRAVLTFKEAGFKKVDGVPAFEEAAFSTPVGGLARASTDFGEHLLSVEEEKKGKIEVAQMGVTELKDLLALIEAEGGIKESKVQLIDVREENEFETAKIEGFVLKPLSRLMEWGSFANKDFDPEAQTVVLCHHGMRSMQVSNFLVQQAGFGRVFNVSGGIDAYSRLVDQNVPRY